MSDLFNYIGPDKWRSLYFSRPTANNSATTRNNQVIFYLACFVSGRLLAVSEKCVSPDSFRDFSLSLNGRIASHYLGRVKILLFVRYRGRSGFHDVSRPVLFETRLSANFKSLVFTIKKGDIVRCGAVLSSKIKPMRFGAIGTHLARQSFGYFKSSSL